MPKDPFAEAGTDPSGGLATGPRDTVTGQVKDAPGDPLDRPGTEAAEAGARDTPPLTPQGRTGDAARKDHATALTRGVEDRPGGQGRGLSGLGRRTGSSPVRREHG